MFLARLMISMGQQGQVKECSQDMRGRGHDSLLPPETFAPTPCGLCIMRDNGSVLHDSSYLTSMRHYTPPSPPHPSFPVFLCLLTPFLIPPSMISPVSRGTPSVTFLADTPAKWKVFRVICAGWREQAGQCQLKRKTMTTPAPLHHTSCHCSSVILLSSFAQFCAHPSDCAAKVSKHFPSPQTGGELWVQDCHTAPLFSQD